MSDWNFSLGGFGDERGWHGNGYLGYACPAASNPYSPSTSMVSLS